MRIVRPCHGVRDERAYLALLAPLGGFASVALPSKLGCCICPDIAVTADLLARYESVLKAKCLPSGH